MSKPEYTTDPLIRLEELLEDFNGRLIGKYRKPHSQTLENQIAARRSAVAYAVVTLASHQILPFVDHDDDKNDPVFVADEAKQNIGMWVSAIGASYENNWTPMRDALKFDARTAYEWATYKDPSDHTDEELLMQLQAESLTRMANLL